MLAGHFPPHCPGQNEKHFEIETPAKGSSKRRKQLPAHFPERCPEGGSIEPGKQEDFGGQGLGGGKPSVQSNQAKAGHSSGSGNRAPHALYMRIQ